MKKFFPYFTLLGFGFLGLLTALLCNWPAGNQIGFVLFGIFSIALFIILVMFDISEYINTKK